MILGIGLLLSSVLIISSPTDAASKQKVRWIISGDCVDEYSEYQTEYEIFEGDTCFIRVVITPALPARKVALQYQSENGKWAIDDEKVTNKKGVAILEFGMYDSDGYFYDYYWDYRIAMARLGRLPSQNSDTFTVTFIP